MKSLKSLRSLKSLKSLKKFCWVGGLPTQSLKSLKSLKSLRWVGGGDPGLEVVPLPWKARPTPSFF